MRGPPAGKRRRREWTLREASPEEEAAQSRALDLAGTGKMAALVRAHDWSSTTLGPIRSWPQSLKVITAFLLEAPIPMVLLWGPQGVMLYNDAYSVFAGGTDKLGKRVSDGWPEVADFNANVMKVGLSGGTLAYRDQELTLYRNGRAEQVWMNLDYSPVRDESGSPAGVMAIVIETTERVLADRRAAAEQERQRQMLRQMPGFVAMLSGPGLVFEYVNETYVATSERTEFVGRRFRDVFADIAGQGFHELFEGVFRSGKGVVTRGMPIRLHGREEIQYVDFVVEPIRDPRDTVIGVFVGGYETTDIHRAAEALRASEARLRELNADLERQVIERTQARGVVWQVTPDLMGALNSEGYFETSNPAWKTVLGWSEEEVARLSIFELLHPDDVERTRDGFNLTQIGQPAIRFPNRYRCKNGAYRWISWVGVPEDGMVYCTGRDITDELAASAERDRLWNLSEDMLARADYGGAMSAVNPAWTKVLGWSERELLTNPYADIIHPEDVGQTVAALQLMSQMRQPTRFENRIRASNGEWKPIGWTVSPEPDGVNFIAVGRDLSDYKSRERELLAAQEALRQSQKMEAVGQLTGGIAHDFNNLLAGISGSVEVISTLLKRGRLDDVDRYITAAQNSSRRAAALTQRLLAFSRRQTLDPKPTDINRLIGGMEELIRRTVGPAVELEVVGAGGLWPAKIDPSQLENALLNLCINARDAMAPDGGRLTIETANKWLDQRGAAERDLPVGQYVSLCVTDTGTGMSPQVMERAFDPFFTTKPLGEGTGLGLSMVYGFARQSGGQVRIYSELGRGTTMCIYLPRHLGDLEEVEAHETLHLAEQGDGETVLIVDDEPTIRMLVRDVLIENHYVPLEAPDGPTALKILQSNMRIDLLITDVGLPVGMNGRQVADAARVSRPGLKILFITGYAENAVVGNGHLEPGMEVLTKPFVIATLGKRIRELIGRKGSRD
jgi:PAS domain S-box-containing protein